MCGFVPKYLSELLKQLELKHCKNEKVDFFDNS